MDKASTPAFRKYQETVIANAQALSGHLQDLGYKIVTGGTDNHIVLVDLTSKKLSGSKAERILEEVGISVNKNTVPGDKSAMNPSGIRFGTKLVRRTQMAQQMTLCKTVPVFVRITLIFSSASLVKWGSRRDMCLDI